jgi:ABC-type nitrate/sulfonate/bicarbonate transport system substrate-binding protein
VTLQQLVARGTGLCVLLLLSACTPALAPPPTSAPPAAAQDARPQQPLGKVRVSTVGVPVTPTFNVPEFARVAGIFEANGIEVEIRNNPAANQSVPPVVTGQADVVYVGIDGVMGAMAQGQPLKIYLLPANTLRFVLVATKEIKDWSDLRGKTIAQVQVKNGSDYALAAGDLKAHGIQEAEVQWIATGDRIPALITNRAQASVVPPEQIVTLKDPNLHVMDPFPARHLPFYAGAAVAARTDWVGQHPDLMRAFVKSLVQAGRRMSTDKAEFVRVGSVLRDDLSADDIGQLWDIVTGMNYWAVNGGIDQARFNQFLEYFFREDHPELADRNAIRSFSDAIDTGPLKSALDQLGVVPGYDQPDWYHR